MFVQHTCGLLDSVRTILMVLAC